ncbi:MAG: 50S ribosomal protein L4 [Deltaproteobacteria bacterium]|nr:50S ribosomal protein L4 [Deltaproteobacteria bacterium]
MAKVAVINPDSSKGKGSAGSMEVSDLILEAPFNPFLIQDAVVYQQAKARQGTHASKTRHMVSGSTRKLYRQKGTGYARAGDRKATQRRGGGIPHGPVPRSHATELNKKVRKAALRSALGEKIRRGELIVLEKLEPATHKTKDFSAWLAGMDALDVLVVTHDIGPNLAQAARNLPSVFVIHFGQLNVYNLLLFKKALVTKDALAALEERLTK